jgi:hypothetical protein
LVLFVEASKTVVQQRSGGAQFAEKYYIALGQSPEAIALMKTDPLAIGFKSL